jgi:hypothetical protein
MGFYPFPSPFVRQGVPARRHFSRVGSCPEFRREAGSGPAPTREPHTLDTSVTVLRGLGLVMCATMLGQAVVPLVGGKERCRGRSTTSPKHRRCGTTGVCRTGWRSPTPNRSGFAGPNIFALSDTETPVLPSALLLLPLQQFHRPPGEEVGGVTMGVLVAFIIECCVLIS